MRVGAVCSEAVLEIVYEAANFRLVGRIFLGFAGNRTPLHSIHQSDRPLRLRPADSYN